VSRGFDNTVSQISYSLKLLFDTTSIGATDQPTKDHRMTDGGEVYQRAHLRADTPHDPTRRPQLGDIGQSHSYPIGAGPPPEKYRRPINTDKARQFFGQMPPPEVSQGSASVGAPPDGTPWFLELDHLNEVAIETKFDPPQLKSGTLRGLVEQLTRHDRLDASFNGTFLLTYRSFTSAVELFELLVQRFSIQPPPGLLREDYPTWEERKQKLVRFRVVNILKSWFETFWMEENNEASKRLLERAYGFAKNTIANTRTPGSGPLMTTIEQRMKGQDTSAKRLVLTLTNLAPAPILPKNMKKLKFLDIDVTEFARQLTIIESKLYGKIKSTECLDKTWQRKVKGEGADPAPNVKCVILHSNQLTNWVAEMILQQAEVKKRVIVIKHFVTIADVCTWITSGPIRHADRLPRNVVF
jgi:son of sevenless